MCSREPAASTCVIVLCVVWGFVLSGCISGRSDVSYGAKGPVVGGETLRQIEVGITSKEWLLGTLGEPTNETQTPDGKEILKYVYTRKVDSDFDAFIFLSFDDHREERTALYFEITDGIVSRYWKEER